MTKMNRLIISLLFFISCSTIPRVQYEGERNQEGEYHGKGVIIYSNGEKYVGGFKDGKYDGQGTFTYSDGSKWEGEWKEGLRYTGKGTIHFESGSKYVGEYKDGKYNGQGTLTHPNGDKYVGEFKDGLRNGQGTYNYPDGRKYVGEFKDNKANGQGRLALPSGAKYVGQWKKGKYIQGTLSLPSGAKYVGEFKDDERNGKGVNYSVNGVIKSGIWKENILTNNWTFEAVENFLKNKYPQFKGFDYKIPTPSVSLQKIDITELPPPPETLTNIAVVDFNGNNISDGEVRALTDRLRTELFNTKYFKVIEREMMQEVIKEQGFQQTGCTTDECMVQIGRLIGVQKIIGGSISKVGNIYSVSSRIVNVETGEIEKTEVYDHTGNIGQLLTEGMRMVAIGLVQ